MCLTALPEHLNSQEEIDNHFPDDSQYSGAFGKLYKWFHKHTKAITAFGPRDVHWIHRWRELPVVLFAVFGPGDSRWEESNGLFAIRAKNDPVFWHWPQVVYLSRVQYWCDWHIQVQWPLFICAHWHGWMFYVGAKRDADKVYWMPSIFIGRIWK